MSITQDQIPALREAIAKLKQEQAKQNQISRLTRTDFSFCKDKKIIECREKIALELRQYIGCKIGNIIKDESFEDFYKAELYITLEGAENFTKIKHVGRKYNLPLHFYFIGAIIPRGISYIDILLNNKGYISRISWRYEKKVIFDISSAILSPAGADSQEKRKQ